jgi:hypothetical protein
MTAFIDQHRAVFGVGPICHVLPIAPSTYYARAAIARDPGLASDRARRDRDDSSRIKRVFDASGGRSAPVAGGLLAMAFVSATNTYIQMDAIRAGIVAGGY